MAKPAKASGIAAEIEAMRSIGMTNEQIQAKLMGSAPAGGAVETQPLGSAQSQNAHQRQDNNLGPDPEIVARHQALLKDYVRPVLEKTYEVTLPRNRADYVERWAAYETAVREAQAKRRNAPMPQPMTPEKAIEIIVGRYWQNDPDRALMAQGGSMSREAFEQTIAPLIKQA